MTACPNAIRAAAGRFHEEQMTRPSRLSRPVWRKEKDAWVLRWQRAMPITADHFPTVRQLRSAIALPTYDRYRFTRPDRCLV